MPLCNNSSGNLAVVVTLLFAGALYIYFFSSSSVSDPISDLLHNVNTLNWTEYPVDELEAVLDRAATGNNKTVIIAMVNKAYVEEVGQGRTMLNLFLESFGEGKGTLPLLDHLMIVAADQKAYDRCLFKRLHCYKMETDGVDLEGEKVYMSKDFIEMMWHRTRLLLDVLSRGYHLIFTDTDVMWLRSPFSRLNKESLDMQISVDNSGVEGHLINTGFYHVRSNNKTISLFQKWYDMRLKSTGMKEQDVLKNLLDSGFFDNSASTLASSTLLNSVAFAKTALTWALSPPSTPTVVATSLLRSLISLLFLVTGNATKPQMSAASGALMLSACVHGVTPTISPSSDILRSNTQINEIAIVYTTPSCINSIA